MITIKNLGEVDGAAGWYWYVVRDGDGLEVRFRHYRGEGLAVLLASAALAVATRD